MTQTQLWLHHNKSIFAMYSLALNTLNTWHLILQWNSLFPWQAVVI